LKPEDFDHLPAEELDKVVPFVKENDQCFLLSHPHGGKLRVSKGTVQKLDVYTITHSCASAKGSSGGALLNEFGCLIGIHSGKYGNLNKAVKIWRFWSKLDINLRDWEINDFDTFMEELEAQAESSSEVCTSLKSRAELPELMDRTLTPDDKFSFRNTLRGAFAGILSNCGLEFTDFLNFPYEQRTIAFTAAAKAAKAVFGKLQEKIDCLRKSRPDDNLLILFPTESLLSIDEFKKQIIFQCGVVQERADQEPNIYWVKSGHNRRLRRRTRKINAFFL
jgi:hypothetical protein